MNVSALNSSQALTQIMQQNLKSSIDLTDKLLKAETTEKIEYMEDAVVRETLGLNDTGESLDLMA